MGQADRNLAGKPFSRLLLVSPARSERDDHASHQQACRFALVTSLAVLDVAETAAQVDASAAEPFRLPASEEEPTYLPWIKVCWQAQEKNCATRSDGRLRNGATTVSVGLYEQEGKPDKVLRITLPHNLMIGPGTRLVIDAGEPMRGAFVSCMPEGCVAD
jgi:invasion protein IalB